MISSFTTMAAVVGIVVIQPFSALITSPSLVGDSARVHRRRLPLNNQILRRIFTQWVIAKEIDGRSDVLGHPLNIGASWSTLRMIDKYSGENNFPSGQTQNDQYQSEGKVDLFKPNDFKSIAKR